MGLNGFLDFQVRLKRPKFAHGGEEGFWTDNSSKSQSFWAEKASEDPKNHVEQGVWCHFHRMRIRTIHNSSPETVIGPSDFYGALKGGFKFHNVLDEVSESEDVGSVNNSYSYGDRQVYKATLKQIKSINMDEERVTLVQPASSFYYPANSKMPLSSYKDSIESMELGEEKEISSSIGVFKKMKIRRGEYKTGQFEEMIGIMESMVNHKPSIPISEEDVRIIH